MHGDEIDEGQPDEHRQALWNQEPSPEIQGGYSWKDPQVHLKSFYKCKHLDIADFVNTGGAHQSDSQVW